MHTSQQHSYFSVILWPVLAILFITLQRQDNHILSPSKKTELASDGSMDSSGVIENTYKQQNRESESSIEILDDKEYEVFSFPKNISKSTAEDFANCDNSRWEAFGGICGIEGTVYTIEIIGEDIYVGGNFKYAGDKVVNNIAKWNGESWENLGSGVSGSFFSSVFDLACIGNELYVCGDFSTAGGIPEPDGPVIMIGDSVEAAREIC